jgi:uncharacterized protein YndB with AHSA1/START domain
MRIILLILLGLVALVVVLILIGACLPRTHRATRTAAYRRAPAEVFEIIANFAALPSWRSGLDGVELLPPNEGRASFREIARRRSITYVVLENRPPEKLVLRIADDRLPFGGTWTYEVSPEADGTRLRITEDGEVRNPLFRCLGRFVFGYTTTMDTYLRDLGKKFGDAITPAP